MAVLYVFSNSIWLNSIESLERDNTERNVERLLNAVDQDIEHLNMSVSDWARWNDTYEFVQGTFPEYPTINLADETFANFQINAMLFYNSSDQLVYGEFFDLIKGEKIPVPQNLAQYIVSDCSLLRHSTIESFVNGIIVIDDQPMFVSSWPVLTNEGEGPIQGSLIMGRYFDEEKIHEIEAITKLKISVYLVDDPQLPREYQKAIESLSTGLSMFIQPINSTNIAGYTLFNDIDGAPSLIARVDVSRAIYSQGLATMNFFIIILFFVLFIFAVIVFILLEKIVVKRLYKLSKDIEKISLHNSFTGRLNESDTRDEISDLILSINKMLKQIQQSQDDLNKAYHSLDDSNKVLKEKIDELEKFKKLTVGRELKMIELKKRINELEGGVKN